MSGKELDIELTSKQGIALEHLQDNTTQYILFGGAGGGGKSWLGVVWLIIMCYKYPETRWFIGREELKRLRESTLVTFFKAAKEYGVPSTDFKYNGQDHYIQFKNKSRIDLLDLKYLPSDPLYERYGSVEYTGGFIDEAGEVHFGAFDVLKTRIGRYNNQKYDLIPAKILITSNPKKNWLYKIFYLPFRDGILLKEYAFIPALSIENPFLDEGYIDNLDSITDKVTKERLKYGNWEYEDAEGSLMQYDRIIDLFTNSHVPGGTMYITADIARFGEDKTTIALWSGYRCEEIKVIPKSSIPEAANTIRVMAITHSVPMSNVVVDEDGVGGGVKDILHCKGFVNNSKPIAIKGRDCNYTNLKSQCGFTFSEIVNDAKVYINCSGEAQKGEIIEELEQLKNNAVDKDGKLSLMPKEKVKDIIGRSPDCSDMLIMRVYFDLPHSARITHWSMH